MTKYLNNGCGLIAKERDRQINELGYNVKHDELYSNNELALAAASYALKDELQTEWQRNSIRHRSNLWPWDKKYWKPTPNDRIKELTKAGALIAAQIDRELYELQKQNKYGNE